MALSSVWKPSTVNSWKGGISFLADSSSGQRGNPYVTDSSGKRYDPKFINDNEGRNQWSFPKELANMQNLTLNYNGQTSKIANGGQAYEGNDISSWSARSKGSLGSSGGGSAGGGTSGGADAGFNPGQAGFGFFPGYLGGEFPKPAQVGYTPMSTAPYNFTDPQKFAQQYGQFNRDETSKNFNQSSDIALKELNLELEGMNSFAPAATALKQSTIASDNPFNQGQRTSQLDSTLPGLRSDLAGQNSRANSYANGQIPDAVQNSGLERELRSQSADNSTAVGFGANGATAHNASDLMSAQQRVQLSQYGDQLLSNNLNQSSQLELSPTEYSDAGNQIKVTPEIGAGRLAASNLTELNNNTLVNPTNALSSTVSQNQFTTGLEQQTRQFNTSNDFAKNQINTAATNDFALQKFNYDVGYANSVAGAYQTDQNTQVSLAQQAAYGTAYSQAKDATQAANTTGAIANVVGTVASAAATGGAFKSAPYTADTGTASTGNAQPTVATQSSQSPGSSTPNQTPVSAVSGDTTGADFRSAPITVPSGSPIPQGYVSTGNNSGGGSQAVPIQSAAVPVQSFARDMGLSASSTLSSNPNQQVTQSLLSSSSAVLGAAGIYANQQPNTQAIGVNSSGQTNYASIPLMRSSYGGAGYDVTNDLKNTLAPIGAVDQQDSANMDKIASSAQNEDHVAQLDKLNKDGDTKGFVNTLLDNVGAGKDIKRNSQDLQTAFAAHQVAQNWDTMSPAQKSLAIAGVGLHGLKDKDGNSYFSKTVVPETNSSPGMNVKESLDLAGKGVNVPSLTNNWNQISTLMNLQSGGKAKSASQLAQFAVNSNVLGSGNNGAEVPNVTSTKLAAAGWKSAPQFGVGAVVTNSTANQAPQGFATVPNTGGRIAVPKGTLKSAVGATTSSLAATAAGTASVSSKTADIKASWSPPDSAYTDIAGHAAPKYWHPGADLFGTPADTSTKKKKNWLGVAAITAVGGVIPGSIAAIDGGKHTNQIAAATVGGLPGLAASTGGFGLFKSKGSDGGSALASSATTVAGGPGGSALVARSMATNDSSTTKTDSAAIAPLETKIKTLNNKNENIELPDGSSHSISDKSIPSAINTSNDLHYAAGISGVALSRIVNGGNNKSIDAVGAKLGNMTLGTSKGESQLTPDNFQKVSTNIKATYSKLGVKSKSDAYQLANQAYAEHRINETDLASMHRTFDMVFDPSGYDIAQQLVLGKDRGLSTPTASQAPVNTPKRKPVPQATLTRAEIIARNRMAQSQGVSA